VCGCTKGQVHQGAIHGCLSLKVVSSSKVLCATCRGGWDGAEPSRASNHSPHKSMLCDVCAEGVGQGLAAQAKHCSSI